MTWLSGWSKRQLITVDSTYIDSDLTDFPVLLKVTASGIFDELGANSKKIAVYTSDHRPCYVEIEKWDNVGNEAWLWTKMPIMVSGTDTSLYLYYDSSHEDNNNYVGIPGSTVAQNVWDEDYILVLHMSQDPTGGSGAIKDSTSYASHGTAYNMESADLKDDHYLDFGDNTSAFDEYIAVPHQSVYNFGTDPFTFSFYKKGYTAWANNYGVISKGGHGDTANSWYLELAPGNATWTINYSGQEELAGWDVVTGLSTTLWQWVSFVRDVSAGNHYIYVDDSIGNTTVIDTLRTISDTGDFWISRVNRGAPLHYGDAALGEIRLSKKRREPEWIKAEAACFDETIIKSYGAEQLVTSGTLAYGNRLKITIPPTYVDSNLSDFPVLIKLSSDSGLSSFDGTLVFDELASDANRKKIAVTAEDGVSECFVEIEKWSDSSEEAWLWVKVPSISASTNTVLYLYYDINGAENTDFIGDIASYAGQQVWTNGFEAVYHMGESSGSIVDSTINGWDSGTPTGSPTRNVDAKVGGGIDWNSPGTAAGSMSFTDNQVTVETWVKHDSVPGSIQRWYTVASEIAVLRHEGSGTVKSYNKLSGIVRAVTASSQVDTDWGYFAGTWNGATQKVYKSGVEVGSQGQTGTLDDATSFSFNSGSETFYGLQDEIRVSTVARPESWLKATYYTCEDGFLYMEEDVIQPGWLGDYDYRIKLTIDPTQVASFNTELYDFPLLVKVSDSAGVNNTDISAFFNELTLSSGTYNKSDYEDDFTGTNGDAPDTDKWTETDSTNSMDIQSNKLHFDGEGSDNKTSYVVSTFMFDGTSAFDVQVDFDLLTWTTPSSNDNYVRLGISTGPVYTWMARQQGTGGATNRMRLYGNGGTNDSAWNWTGTTGKFRFTWDGTSVLKAYVWTGSQWEWNGNTAGYTCSEIFAGDEIGVNLLFEQETNGGDVEATFDNFQINSGHVIYDLNRKKVAFTTANGTTECYTEIESFDAASEEAWYWVSVPIVSNTENTILYLYYDAAEADNTTYVGDVTDAVAQQVWDSNFVMVQHMANNPTDNASEAMKDSTSYGNTGTPVGFEGNDWVNGQIAKATSYDGSERIEVGHDSTLAPTDVITYEVLAYNTDWAGDATAYSLVSKTEVGGYSLIMNTGGVGAGNVGVSVRRNGTYGNAYSSRGALSGDDWHYFVGSYDGRYTRWYVDGVYQTLDDAGGTYAIQYTNSNSLLIGAEGGTGTTPGSPPNYFIGSLDEARVSNVVRSGAYIRANYQNLWDNLVIYGQAQTQDQFIFQGTVEVQGTPTARKVYLYRRDTGELVSETTSDALSGLFAAGSPYWDYHFFVILPELTETYDLIAHDKIHPEN